MKPIKIEKFTELNDFILNTVVDLEKQIFEKPLTIEIIKRKLEGRHHIIILLASENEKVCGYKIGFEFDSDNNHFYSWNGGVLPAHRNQGIAQRLMQEQHVLAKSLGFTYVRTHTKNKYREMLILNIKSGFDVTGVHKKLSELHHGIILEKEL